VTQHTGVDRRNRFLPPRLMVYRLPVGAGGIAALPKVPMLLDLEGDQPVVERAAIRLGWDDTALHLRADIHDDAAVIRPDCAPESSRFWEQDHIELRLLPDPAAELAQVQCLLAASGRMLVAGAADPAVVESSAARTADGWTLSARIPFAALGLARPACGTVLRGLVAHMRWANDYPEIACCTACELGFSQAERFAELVLSAVPPPVQLDGIQVGAPAPDGPSGYARAGCWRAGLNPARIQLTGADQHGGVLLVTRETEPDGPSHTTRYPVAGTVALELELERPLYTRYGFRWRQGGRTIELGAVTLRASVAATVPEPNCPHPYLFFDADMIPSMRRRAAEPLHAAVVEREDEAALVQVDIPDPDSDAPFLLTERDGGWLRVARESMLRDGAGGKWPAIAHIWKLMTSAEQAAWREIDATTDSSPAARKQAIAGLNRLLRRRDLHDAAAFEGVRVPAVGRRLLKRGIDALDDGEVIQLNRLLLGQVVECIHHVRADLASLPYRFFNRWLVSGDPSLIEQATRAVRAAHRFTVMGPGTDLHPGGISTGIAIAYDAFRPHLDAADREAWLAFADTLLDLHLYTARRLEWNCTTVPNANPVCNGGGGLLAMAVLDELPEKAQESLYWSRRLIRHWLDYCNGPDGGNTEGAQYWQYGCENFLRYAAALERVLGHDDGLLDHPAIRHAMNMVRVGLTNDGGMHGMNDTIPLAVGGGIAWFLAGRFDDAFALWYGDHARRMHAARLAAGDSAPYKPNLFEALVYRPPLAESHAAPPFPTALVLRSIEYGVLRSAPAYDSRWVVGLKGSRPPYTHHNQPDTGAFSIDLRGERLMIDPGYYKGRPADHCMLIVNDQPAAGDHPVAYTGRLSVRDRCDGVRELACDASGAYAGVATRVIRHLVMLGEDGIVLLDDVASEHPVTAWYQAGGETRPAGEGAVLVEGRAARLRLDVAVPRPDGSAADMRIACLPERSLKDVHWGYCFAACRHFPAWTGWHAGDGHPLISVFQDATTGDPGAPVVTRDARELCVRLASGREAVFVRRSDGWELDGA